MRCMTEEMQVSLLSCPFCGGEARSHKCDIRPGYQTSSVCCKKCQAQIGRCDLDAEEFWNRRQRTDWQPIETAPKDGTHVIVAFTINVGEAAGQKGVAESRYMPHYWDGLFGPDFTVSHWMPLPTSPNDAEPD